MRDMVQYLTAMMVSLISRMDQMDGGGRKRRKVTFRSTTPDADTSTPSAPSGAYSPATSQPSTSRLQPHDNVTVPASTAAMAQPHPPPAPAPVTAMTTYQENAPPPLPDVSEAVRARVTQRLQGALDPFLLTDEDLPSDEKASPGKRKIELVSLFTGDRVRPKLPTPLTSTFVPTVSGWLRNCVAIRGVGATTRQRQKMGSGGLKSPASPPILTMDK